MEGLTRRSGLKVKTSSPPYVQSQGGLAALQKKPLSIQSQMGKSEPSGYRSSGKSEND